MIEVSFSTAGFTRIAQYFEDPKNHLNKDKKHVSREEFKSALAKIDDKETEELLKIILYSGSGYNYLQGLQAEGNFNDKSVSLRDLYAAGRGSSYDGKSLLGDKDFDRFFSYFVIHVAYLRQSREIE